MHGEVARSAGFNGGVGCFGPGNRANATVGRAVRLVMLHVAGAKPGFGDAATHGQPAKYTFCAAENLAESPWESYARSRGVDAPSAVTVHCGEGPHNVHDAEAAGDPQLILDKIASAMTSLGHEQRADQPGRVLHRPRTGARGEHRPARLVAPRRASYLFDRARMPAAAFRRHFEELAWTQWMKTVADDHLLPMTAEPDNIRVVVAGGPGQAFARRPVVGHDPQRHPARGGLRGAARTTDDLTRLPAGLRAPARPLSARAVAGARSPACASPCSTTASPTPTS